MAADLSKLASSDLERSILASVRRRVSEGRVKTGADIVAIRLFVGLTAVDFALAFGISPETL